LIGWIGSAFNKWLFIPPKGEKVILREEDLMLEELFLEREEGSMERERNGSGIQAAVAQMLRLVRI
jgi:hypothetical protein